MLPDHDDDQLIRAYLAGDDGAFDAVIRSSEDDLRCFVLARCRHAEDVEEIVQYAYVVAFRRLADYRQDGSFRAWLKGIAHKRWLELRRERQRQNSRFESELDRLWQETHAASEQWLQARLQRMQQCLQRLPSSTRRLLLQHHVDGLSLAALAQRFRIKTGTVAKRLFDCRRRLRHCVEAGHEP
ncbi:MAG: RNA polymerase sigma factor [Planctomycetota bacterium]